MNAVTTTESTALAQRGMGFDLSPQNFEQAMTFSKYLAESEMVPKQYRGRPGDCLIAMQWGHEIGLKPLQALQSIAPVNGKPNLYGDAGKAMLLAAGCEIDEDDTAIIRATGTARCKITRPGRRPVERTFSIEDAKTAQLWGKAGPWTTSPYRQMAWRAFWFAARDAAADLLRGMGGKEEADDYVAERHMGNVERVEPTPQQQAAAYTDEQFTTLLPDWRLAIAAGKASATSVIAKIKTKGAINDEQTKAIEAPITAAELAEAAKKFPPKTAPAAAAVTDVQPKNEAAAPAPTFAEVSDRLHKAADLDALNVAADLISAVQEEQHRTELTALFEERKFALEAE
jgi:hypothetical protein